MNIIIIKKKRTAGKRMMALEVQGKRGRTKERGSAKIKADVKEKGVRREQTQDRAAWRRLVQHIDPT